MEITNKYHGKCNKYPLFWKITSLLLKTTKKYHYCGKLQRNIMPWKTTKDIL